MNKNKKRRKEKLLPIKLVRTLVCNCMPPSDTPPKGLVHVFLTFRFFLRPFLTESSSIHGSDNTDYPLLSLLHVISPH